MPDFFHCLHDIVKTLFARAWPAAAPRPAGVDPGRGAPRAPSACSRRPGHRGRTPCEWRHAVLKSRNGARCSARTGSTWRPSRSPSIPSTSTTTTAQTSTQVARRLHAEVEAIEALAARHQFPACHAARTKVRKQLPALAALVDFWWAGCGAGFGARRAVDDAGRHGPRSISCPVSIGPTTWRTPAVRGGKPSCARRWRRAKRRLTTTCSPSGCPSKPWRSGRHGPASVCAPFSGPRPPSKAAMALSRKCIITSADCHGSATRCGPSA